MPPKDVDALAVWDAKARTLIDRIDAVLDGTTAMDEPPADPLHALVHAVIDRTQPPPGEILTPDVVHRTIDRAPWSAREAGRATTTSRPTITPTNMEHQPDRIDHWDAYVCRFDGDGAGEPDQPTP